jgi:hypothetical protein
MTAPLLWAALRADLPRTTVSRDAPAPRVLLPIFVTVSQSSMVGELIEMDPCVCCVFADVRLKARRLFAVVDRVGGC